MASNYIQPGDNLTIPAPANCNSGDIVVAGEIIGIAAGNATAGQPVDVQTGRVWTLPKVGIVSFALGGPVYYDSAAKLATSDDDEGANPKIGVAVAVATDAASSVKVRLSSF
jgi:predicted RecA/RadA family phage recombinase